MSYTYNMNSYVNSYDPSTAAALGMYTSMVRYMSIALVVCYVLQVIAMWKIFTKAGEAGWKSLIPIYNIVTMFKVAGITPWLVLAYLLAVIPVIGSLIVLGIQIYFNVKLSKSFGKGVGFAVGLILLTPIFYLILGFGNSTYVGSNENAA